MRKRSARSCGRGQFETMHAQHPEQLGWGPSAASKYELLECPPESEWGKHGGTLRQIADHLDMPPDCDYPMVDINNWRDSLQYILSHPGSLDKPWATLGARSQYFSHLSSLVWGGACSPQFVIFSIAFI